MSHFFFSFTEPNVAQTVRWNEAATKTTATEATTNTSQTKEKKRKKIFRAHMLCKQTSGRQKTALYVAIDWIFSLFCYSSILHWCCCCGCGCYSMRHAKRKKRNIVWHSYNLLAIVLCANILSEMFKPHRFQFGGKFFTSRCHSYTLQRTRGFTRCSFTIAL